MDRQDPGDSFTKELAQAVQSVRDNEKWRVLNVQWTFAQRGPERSGVEKDYMTLQMSYQEKFEQGLEQGIEQGKMESALRMIEAGKLSMDEIALYTGLSLKYVLKLKKR